MLKVRRVCRIVHLALTFFVFRPGAFRMRQIGRGQTIELIVVPEVDMLVEVQVAAGRGKVTFFRLHFLFALCTVMADFGV